MKKIIVTFFLLLFLTSCTQKQEIVSQTQINTAATQKQAKQKIFTSFYPLYFLTKGLVGDDYEVVNLIPTGGDGHNYEPTPKQIQGVLSSSYMLFNGLGLERYEEKLVLELEKNKVPYSIIGEKYENLIELEEKAGGVHEDENHENEHGHGSIDPHTWLSLKVMKDLAEILTTDLGVQESGKAKIFISSLETLDTKFRETLKLCKTKELVTSHEAFGYLARDYGLVQVAVAGIEPDMEPSAADIARVIEIVKDKKISTIFTEPLVSPKFTDTIARETGVRTLELHPLETLTPEEEAAGEDYLSIMEKNLAKIVEGLQCK